MGIKRYKEFCALLGLTQIINDATRITKTTSSLLDHILTNSKDKICQSGVIDIGISDHQRYIVQGKYIDQIRRKNIY